MKRNSKEWLKQNGFDGLFLSRECGCCLDDFNPCGEDTEDCTPGYKHFDPRPGKKGEFVIYSSKEPPTLRERALFDC